MKYSLRRILTLVVKLIGVSVVALVLVLYEQYLSGLVLMLCALWYLFGNEE